MEPQATEVFNIPFKHILFFPRKTFSPWNVRISSPSSHLPVPALNSSFLSHMPLNNPSPKQNPAN